MTCDKVLVVAVLGSLATAAVWLEQGLLVLGEMVEEMTMLVTGSVATRGSVYRAPNLMVGASPCALDVAPLAYATAINHCARKECFEAGRTEKNPWWKQGLHFRAAATVGIVLAQRATAPAIDVACVLTAKIFPGACLFLSPVHAGQANVALPLITSIFLAFLFIYFEFPSPLVNSMNLFDSHL
ncbi:putative CADMIUM/ZINC-TRANSPORTING ATPASE HMA1 [Salix purpurea]|uniref:CADMIUM/ZINC-TRANSPORTING ATPASE HMA1 n=1 Tax=Salix purpurea TaxID=77065 RepID=A0A9Q0USZ1_SALPP|nr:putative CADMIUM/ZINC-TRANSPORTING ATPASE HMA1 [Salix purpurea]